jgi:putative transferase (TIGR04331 family)
MIRISIISSSIEETWPSEGKVVFLGEWCCIHSRVNEWQKIDYEIADYHWNDREKLRNDYQTIKRYYEFYLKVLADKLNEIHSTNHSIRYWRILIGWWLFYFIGVLFDKWQIIKNAEKKYPNAIAVCLSNSNSIQPAQNMHEFITLVTQDDLWSEGVFSLLFKNFSTLVIKEVEIENSVKEFMNKTTVTTQINSKLIGKLKYLVKFLVNGLSTRKFLYGNGISIESSYLSRLNLIKLFLMNRQLPYSLNFEPPGRFITSFKMRDWLLPSMSGGEFDQVLNFFIPKFLPTIYLEGYQQIKIRADQKISKKQFKTIVTANDFSANDSWKAWAAMNVEAGSKLIVMQHGGFYGVNSFSATEDHEIAISDTFLSWGWSREDSNKVIPSPANKLIHLKNKGKFQNNGPAILIAGALPQQSYHISSMPIGPQFLNYYNDQCRFLNALSPEIKAHLQIKLYPSDFGWNQHLRWKNFDPTIQILSENKPLLQHLQKAKLSISTYNATTFLETFVMGIPTVMFWDDSYWELNNFARPYYHKLLEAKILFHNPEKSAEHINQIWDNPLLWWKNAKTQEAVEEFLEVFANVPKKSITKLSKLINLDH